jgi:pimeloyl-ACP methyl ester carboxylesterase
MIEARRGRRVHVIEAGEGSPVVFLHGSGTSSLSALSLLEHLEGVRMIAVDRPGYGLSDPVDVPRKFRTLVRVPALGRREMTRRARRVSQPAIVPRRLWSRLQLVSAGCHAPLLVDCAVRGARRGYRAGWVLDYAARPSTTGGGR